MAKTENTQEKHTKLIDLKTLKTPLLILAAGHQEGGVDLKEYIYLILDAHVKSPSKLKLKTK